MPDLGDLIEFKLASLALSEESVRCTVEWAGVEMKCVGSPEKDTYRLDDAGGGYKPVRHVEIELIVSNIPVGIGLPKKGHTVKYRKNGTAEQTVYRIKGVEDSYGAWLKLDCESPNKGA